MVESSSYEEFKQFMEQSVDSKKITNKYLKNLSKWLRTKEHSLHIMETQDGLDISMSMLQDSLDKNKLHFIDLKQYFMASPKAKPTKNGGWYLIVPVGGTHPVRSVRDIYGRMDWDNQISQMNFGETFQGTKAVADKLQAKFGKSNNVIPELQYEWKSANITRVPYGKSGTRGQYLTFRTVSNKSDPNSWIIGRQDLSNQIQENNSHNERQLGSVVAAIINNYVNEYNNQRIM